MIIRFVQNLLIGRWQERLSIEARIRILLGFGFLAWIVAFVTLALFLSAAPFFTQVLGYGLSVVNGASLAAIGLWCFSLRDPRDNHMPTELLDAVFWGLFIIGIIPIFALQYFVHELSEVYPLIAAFLMPFTVALIRIPPVIGFMVISLITAAFAVGSETETPLVYWFALWSIGLACWSVVLSTNMELLSQRELRASNDQLQLAQNTIEQFATRQERLRIGRDLHDQMGHNLTALQLQLQICDKLLEKNNLGQLGSHIEKAQSNADALFNELRQVVHKLRVQGETDFIEALSELTNGFDGLKINVIDNLDVNFPPLQAADDLMYCIKECITNTIKHSNANELSITISQNPIELKIEIEDNGSIPPDGKQGYGLQGVAERMAAWQGHFDAGFTHGQGFHVILAVPLEAV